MSATGKTWDWMKWPRLRPQRQQGRQKLPRTSPYLSETGWAYQLWQHPGSSRPNTITPQTQNPSCSHLKRCHILDTVKWEILTFAMFKMAFRPLDSFRRMTLTTKCRTVQPRPLLFTRVWRLWDTAWGSTPPLWQTIRPVRFLARHRKSPLYSRGPKKQENRQVLIHHQEHVICTKRRLIPPLFRALKFRFCDINRSYSCNSWGSLCPQFWQGLSVW